MSQISNIVPTTELEAVNTMLAAIGEMPIDSTELATPTMALTTLAINTLKNAAREVLNRGWKFNMEFGLQVVRTTTYAWTGTDGSTATLGIFKRPAGMLRFFVTQTPDQQGPQVVDTVLKPSRKYQEAAAFVEVFYDRILNRDGFDTSKRTYLYIDPIWAIDYESMPEEARRYIAILAARRFIGNAIGSTTLQGFTQNDELQALLELKDAQEPADDYNMMNNWDTASWMGWRPFSVGGISIDPNRKSPGTV